MIRPGLVDESESFSLLDRSNDEVSFVRFQNNIFVNIGVNGSTMV